MLRMQGVMKDNSIITNPTTEELSEAKCSTTLAIINSTKVGVLSSSHSRKSFTCRTVEP